MNEEIVSGFFNLAFTGVESCSRTLLNFTKALANGTFAVGKGIAGKVEKHNSTGKQNLAHLLKNKDNLENIPIEKTDIKDFEPILKKYKIDYTILKDTNTDPPKYTMFFKAKDAQTMELALDSYSKMKLKTKEKPSAMKQIEKYKDLVMSEQKTDKMRIKDKEPKEPSR